MSWSETFTINNDSSFYLKTTTGGSDNCVQTASGDGWAPQKLGNDSVLLAGSTGQLTSDCKPGKTSFTSFVFTGDCAPGASTSPNATVYFDVPSWNKGQQPSLSQLQVVYDEATKTITFTDADGACPSKPWNPPTPKPPCADAGNYGPCGGNGDPGVWNCSAPPLADGAACPKASAGYTCQQAVNPGSGPSGFWQCKPE